jgi:hypothetical protein
MCNVHHGKPSKNMEHGFPCSAHTININVVHKHHSILFSYGYLLGPLKGEWT